MKKITLALYVSMALTIGTCWADYSGLWWDPSKAGQGISIIQNHGSICGAWYLYDSSGKNMWLVFTGVLNSSNSFSTQLFRYTGPALGSPWDVNQVKSGPKGTATLTFNSKSSITMNYALDGLSGTLNLEPFANDAASMYWDPNKPGQGVGFFMEGRNAYLVWYLYDKNGEDMWVTSGTDVSPTSTTTNLYEFTGPALGSAWDASQVQSTVVGNASLALDDSGGIPINYNILGVPGTMNMVPFVCSVSQCTSPSSGTYEGTAPVTSSNKEECGYFAQVVFVLCDNSISGEAVDNFADGYFVRGTVDSEGNVSGSIYTEDDLAEEHPVGTFKGAVSGDTISGTWDDVWGCSGTYSVQKTHSASEILQQ